MVGIKTTNQKVIAMTSKQIAADIKRGMALAFFASAYADQADEAEQPLMGEIMEQLPPVIDRAAIHAAHTLSLGIIEGFTFGEKGLNDTQKLAIIFRNSVHLQNQSDDKGDRELTPELFGHYCAMQAMGHGVGLDSFGQGVYDYVEVPYVEFGGYSLEKDYFDSED